ncbi:MAG: DSD1 family PLP-dependent enzyme [Gammaproteobacteria bacterium]|nr:DSD1 family PLP-dependent enzyme [Gammaproteobacteria bacterium]
MNEPLNNALIGSTGSAAQLQTPALVLDLDRFMANVKHMAKHCQRTGIQLRPHAKTHKCIEIAKRQIAAGAVGICCAKLGEAEVMGKGGIGNILITSPVVTDGGLDRLIVLNNEIPDLMVVADNGLNIDALAKAASSADKPLKVLLDLDPGLHRTGIRPGDEALLLARKIAGSENLEFMGLQMYAGQLMHIENYQERRDKSAEVMVELDEMKNSLVAEDIECRILTGGGTGTFDIDAEINVLTELQGGSYIFMDRQYNQVHGPDGRSFPFQTSLFVQMTVISNNTRKLATTDAGFKSFATDADAPLLDWGAPQGASYFFFGDEQGGIAFADEADQLSPGAVLRAVTPHCDPTVNLYDSMHVIQGDKLVGIWRIDARG